MRRPVYAALVSLTLASALAHPVIADTPSIAIEVAETEATWYGNGVAVDGNDVVSYFAQQQPLEGSEEFTTVWQNAEWQFSSQDNLEAFEADPERYAPQFGGYCPTALAHSDVKIGTPEQFAVISEKLYLNVNYDANLAFRNDSNNLIARANVNWRELVSGR
ncbi:MAG: YHS domain-containing (seleno)protein [Pseudomonadota bacterium]